MLVSRNIPSPGISHLDIPRKSHKLPMGKGRLSWFSVVFRGTQEGLQQHSLRGCTEDIGSQAPEVLLKTLTSLSYRFPPILYSYKSHPRLEKGWRPKSTCTGGTAEQLGASQVLPIDSRLKIPVGLQNPAMELTVKKVGEKSFAVNSEFPHCFLPSLLSYIGFLNPFFFLFKG